MAYKTYTTEALVCGSNLHNTSDKSFLLFTKDAGMVYATARSVREERSKQRYALQEFSLIRVSLVKGKQGWRIGSVHVESNMFGDVHTRKARKGVLDIVRRLRQFVHGEESHPGLFADTVYALGLLEVVSDPWRIVEIHTLRTLHALGYIEKTKELQYFLESSEDAYDIDHIPPQVALATEQALTASHL